MTLHSDLDLALREAAGLRGCNELYLLCDEHTRTHCAGEILKTFPLEESHILCVSPGEETKSPEGLFRIWDFLMTQGATRSSLLIVLGGGVLTDAGGFAAATFKRGIPYVNIPTTLLAMVDASQGGKTGINYKGLKNEIGLFAPPERTIVHIPFLATLPREELLSGYAEMLKHALIASPLELNTVMSERTVEALEQTVSSEEAREHLGELIGRSADIKQYIAEQDPEEKGIRKSLNFGHTIGHAIEEDYSMRGQQLLHGYAVAYGMAAELYLSMLKAGLSQQIVSTVGYFIKELYGKPTYTCKDYDSLLDLMRHDKKNERQGEINFTLLRTVGNYRINQTCSEEEIKEALDYLTNM